jgi:hypothetical protein
MLSSQIAAEKTRCAFRWLGESYPRDVQVADIPHLKAR